MVSIHRYLSPKIQGFKLMLNLSIVLPLKYPIAFNKSSLIALIARKN
jgi:hypothetical protein